MRAEREPTVEELGDIITGCAEGGTFDYIRRGVEDVARSTLTGRPLAAAVARVRDVTAGPEWRAAFAADVLARLDRPLAEVDADTLVEAMGAAGQAEVYALGEAIAGAIVEESCRSR